MRARTHLLAGLAAQRLPRTTTNASLGASAAISSGEMSGFFTSYNAEATHADVMKCLFDLRNASLNRDSFRVKN